LTHGDTNPLKYRPQCVLIKPRAFVCKHHADGNPVSAPHGHIKDEDNFAVHALIWISAKRASRFCLQVTVFNSTNRRPFDYRSKLHYATHDNVRDSSAMHTHARLGATSGYRSSAKASVIFRQHPNPTDMLQERGC